jgi:hypothetical protein
MAETEREEHLITPEEARRYLEEERAQRLERCAAELGETLTRYGCRLVGRVQVTADGRLAADVQLEAE